MFNRKASGTRASAAAKSPSSFQDNLPLECLRSKLVSTFHDQQGGLLKRSSTDELVRPGTLLGKGTFGVVKLRQDKTNGEPYAVKTMDKPAHWDRKRLVREAIVLMHLDHPYVQRMFGWHDDPTSITMVLEYCAGGELLDAIGEARKEGEILRENWAAFMVKQLFEAMAYLHAKDLVHMDIKSGNILLLHEPTPDIKSLFKQPPHVVVADLGLAIVLDPSTSWFRKKLAGDAKGTPATMAPEVWRGDIGPKNDVWSLGCILYELFCDRLPYLPDDPHDKSQKTWERLYKQEEANCKQRLEVRDISAEVKQVCTSLLTVDHKYRPNVKDLLTNSWFTRFLASGGMGSGLQQEDINNLGMAMRRWERMRPMHRAVCLKLASESRLAARFATVFSVFDTDGDGVLNKAELTMGLRRLLIEEEVAINIAASLDFNSDGICEYVEFSAACLLSLGQDYQEILRQEWMIADAFGDGKGKLKSSSFKKLVDKLKPLFAPREVTVEQFFSEFGSRDGLLSFNEFAEALGGVEHQEKKTSSNEAKKPEVPSEPQREVVQYLSKSHGKWIDTTILDRRADGAVQLQIKPGYWMEAQELEESVRDSAGKPYKISGATTSPPAAPTRKASKEAAGRAVARKGNQSGTVVKSVSKQRLNSAEKTPKVGGSESPSASPGVTPGKGNKFADVGERGSPASAKAMLGPGGEKVLNGKSREMFVTNETLASTESVTSSLAPLPPEDEELPANIPSVKRAFVPGGLGLFTGPTSKASNLYVPTDGMLDASLPLPPADKLDDYSQSDFVKNDRQKDILQNGSGVDVASLNSSGEFKKGNRSDSSSIMDDASLNSSGEFKQGRGRAASPKTRTSVSTNASRSNSPPEKKDAQTAKVKKGKAMSPAPSARGSTPTRAEEHSPKVQVKARSPEEHRQALEQERRKGLKRQDSGNLSNDGSQYSSHDSPRLQERTLGSRVLPPVELDVGQRAAPDGKVRTLKFDAKKNEERLKLAVEAFRESRPNLSQSFDMPRQKEKKSLLGGLKASLTGSKAPRSKEKANEEAKEKEWAQFCKAYVTTRPGTQTGRPIVVIDWDDTLVATTFIHREVMGGQPLHTLGEVHRQSKYYEDFVHYSHLVECVLRSIKRWAHVAVLTLASRWWIEASLDTYFFDVDMRAVLDELDIDVFHADLDAPTVLALTDPSVRRVVAKRTAFSTCLKGFYGTDTVLWNVMSVGDAMVEHDALKAVLELEGKSRNSTVSGLPLCKTVKFNHEPSLRDLIRQLESFLETVETMIHCDKSFHRVLV